MREDSRVTGDLLEHFADQVRTDCVLGVDNTYVTLLRPRTLPKLALANPRHRRACEVLPRPT